MSLDDVLRAALLRSAPEREAERNRTLAPPDLAIAITEGWRAFAEKDRRTSAPRDYVYASSWRSCERRMVYEMTAVDAPAWTAEQLARFRRGDDRERDLLADLDRIGRNVDPRFDVIGQQQGFKLRDRKGRNAISGKVDALLDFGRDYPVQPPVEIKAWSPFLVDRIERFEDVFANPWTRGGGYQLLAYLYGHAQPFGFLLLDRSGLPLLLPVVLDDHLDRMEDFLSRAERAIDHRLAGTWPDYLVGDAAECQRCPYYGGACNPPLVHEGATILNDPDLEALLERRDQLVAAAKEFDGLDTKVKKRLRGIEHGVAGAFSITGTWGKSTRVELPPALKAQYTVVDPKGRFTLEVVKL